MATAADVAAYILHKHGPMTAMKLQKLVYYSQAWSLVWDEKPIFTEEIEAWANGPVCPTLYRIHSGHYQITSSHFEHHGNPSNLNKDSKETIDLVLSSYGKKTSQYLSDLTHKEAPWIKAREGLAPGERGNVTIKLDSMAEYYSGLAN